MGLESVYYNGIYVDIYLYNNEGPKVEGGWPGMCFKLNTEKHQIP